MSFTHTHTEMPAACHNPYTFTTLAKSLLPLIHHLSSSSPSYTPPKDLPQGIKFRKTKITLHEQEYWPLILATSKWLCQIEDYMEKRETPEKNRENVLKLLGSFKDLENTLVWIVDGVMYVLS